MKLLLVDDCEANGELLQNRLEKAQSSFEVYRANNAAEAIHAIEETPYDALLVSDQVCAGNGKMVLQAIKQLPQSRVLPTIVMSNSTCKEHLLDFMRVGAHDIQRFEDVTLGHIERASLHALNREELQLRLDQSYEYTGYLEEHDTLTELANRSLFEVTLQEYVAGCCVKTSNVALLLFNLNRFKLINDTYGHHVGDELLKEVSRRVAAILPKDQFFARLGGDEFALVLSEKNYMEIECLSKDIFAALAAEFVIEGISISISLSMGAAIYPDNCSTASELLRSADIAMSRAKQNGFDVLCAVDESAQALFKQRYWVENELRKAIDENQFELHFQPVVNAESHQLVSCEALIRWRHPEKGLLYPDAFIAIAEETGLIVDIGRWIIDSAFQQLQYWQGLGHRKVVMALNVSPQQLYDPKMVDYLHQKTQEYALSSQDIELEITETTLLENTKLVSHNLMELHARGYHLALDDFGTGFSSIQHLQSFPINTVKIDRSLMPVDGKADKAVSLLQGLTYMVNQLQLSMVAEGIETSENADMCRALGVSRLQGYHFGKPMTALQFQRHFLEGPSLAVG